MKVAIIGSGISGMGCAWALRKVWNDSADPADKNNSLTVFESGSYIGGHTNTLQVPVEKLGDEAEKIYGGKPLSVDTGFIVYNDGQYPNLIRFFEDLKVETQDSDMSFSLGVRGLEWGSDGLNGLFAQRSNIFNPRFWRMVWDMFRFNSEAPEVLFNVKYSDVTLGEYAEHNGYSQAFMNWYLLPMTGAIWSTPMGEMKEFPIQAMITFMSNHKLLQINDRWQWKTVKGGSKEYVKKLVKFVGEENFKVNCAVKSVTREHNSKVLLKLENGSEEEFDAVVFATHADATLELIRGDSTTEERQALNPFQYKPNTAYLHGDESYMPSNRRAWTSWNVTSKPGDTTMTLTYWMNRLQTWMPMTAKPVFVTLNPQTPPDPEKTYAKIPYSHPIYNPRAIKAQKKVMDLQGSRRSYFAGAYLGFGFHEDGLTAGMLVAQKISGKAPFEIDTKRYQPTKVPVSYKFGIIQSIVTKLAPLVSIMAVGWLATMIIPLYWKK